ncbi:type 4a pilus biogenesis protein PilO [Marinobacterium sp. LSUCC0821]|jgi:type IV pilus assembly protein PilO|uniref:type 4a pilus biogenesis protein PilO n=1 Tax=Marinobacterium sp. LSUCC0821 TaxID=2668067 RepID=UPI00145115BA|nr:type 4a pilus biogenesis protein PilO [Marinobacterium sp. LSUCC0821]QJD71985.1 type 4a pilus biogenesis protein PilO [Marinobacterium sp. LSUCC0821]
MSLRQSLNNAFKGFDVNNLDFSTAWSWPIGVKIVTYLLVFAVLLGGGINFLVLDKNRALESEIAKESDLKQQFETKSYQVATLDALRRQMADVELRFAELLRQLPTQKEVPGLLEDISAIGQSAGLEIDLIALQPERKAQFYVELPISVQVRGTYHQMGDFVSGVAGIKRIVTLHDFSLKPSGGDQLTMSIDAKTYRYDDEE